MSTFSVYPAIDLRAGKVVRLVQGDPERQTVFDDNPARVAQRWIKAGASWLHVVNLDGAFSGTIHEDTVGNTVAKNIEALRTILTQACGRAKVQFGGGLRSLENLDQLLSLGVDRVILGTAAIESPELVSKAIACLGPERIVVGIDARDHQVRIRGWMRTAEMDPITLGQKMRRLGVERTVYTNIARDGAGSGIDVTASQRLAETTGLKVIASGGAASLADVQRVRAAGLDGVIIGKALYTGQIEIQEALEC